MRLKVLIQDPKPFLALVTAIARSYRKAYFIFTQTKVRIIGWSPVDPNHAVGSVWAAGSPAALFAPGGYTCESAEELDHHQANVDGDNSNQHQRRQQQQQSALAGIFLEVPDITFMVGALKTCEKHARSGACVVMKLYQHDPDNMNTQCLIFAKTLARKSNGGPTDHDFHYEVPVMTLESRDAMSALPKPDAMGKGSILFQMPTIPEVAALADRFRAVKIQHVTVSFAVDKKRGGGGGGAATMMGGGAGHENNDQHNNQQHQQADQLSTTTTTAGGGAASSATRNNNNNNSNENNNAAATPASKGTLQIRGGTFGNFFSMEGFFYNISIPTGPEFSNLSERLVEQAEVTVELRRFTHFFAVKEYTSFPITCIMSPGSCMALHVTLPGGSVIVYYIPEVALAAE